MRVAGGRGWTHIGQVTDFGVHDDGYREPLVRVLDLRTQESLQMESRKFDRSMTTGTAIRRAR